MDLRRVFFALSVFVLGLLLSSCDAGRPYVKVAGASYTEKDLKAERPQVYKRLRGNYENQVKRALESFAKEKLYEIAAKDKGFQDANAYRSSLSQKVETPTDEEVKAKFDFFKDRGQLQGKKLSDMRSQLVSYIRNEKRREILQSEEAKLKAQYGFEEGPIVRKKVSIKGEPMRSKTGQVTVVEFSGYECGYCKKVQKAAREVRQKYGDKLKWVVKDYPLRLNSLASHVAASCVFQQDEGKYWSYFDKLFAEDRKPDALREDKLEAQARALGVDMGKYKLCLKDKSIQDEIRRDHEEGQDLGVRGIPHFFINGRPLSGARPAYAFEKLIDAELHN